MLRLEPLEARAVPALVVDVTLDFTTGRITPAEGGVLHVSEIVADGSREYLDPDVLAALFAGTLDPSKLTGITARPVSAAGAADALLLTRSPTGGVALESAEALFGRFHVNGQSSLVYLGHRFAVEGVAAVDVDLQLGGADLVANFAGLPAVVRGGAGDDVLFGTGGGGVYLAPDIVLLWGTRPNCCWRF